MHDFYIFLSFLEDNEVFFDSDLISKLLSLEL